MSFFLNSTNEITISELAVYMLLFTTSQHRRQILSILA